MPNLSISGHGDGDLTAAKISALLEGIPGEAIISITQNDTDDYRTGGRAAWWFKAKWDI